MNTKTLSISFIVGLIILINIIVISAVCPSGISGHWKFDEGLGTTASDSINSNDGTINNAIWTNDGKVGKALNFNGIDNYVKIQKNTTFDYGNNSFSVSVWVKPQSFNGYAQRIIWKNDNILQPVFTGYYLMTADISSRDYRFIFGIGDGTSKVEPTSDVALTAGNWYYVVGVRDKNAGKVRLYVNGTEVSNLTDIIPGNIDYSNGSLIFGAHEVITEFFNGTIDEVAVFNRALTPIEIQNYYNKGLLGLNYCEDIPVCTQNWQCGIWSSCSNKQKTRTCIDINNCNNSAGKPIETDSCSSGGGRSNNHDNINNYDNELLIQTLSGDNLNTEYNLDNLIDLTKVSVESNNSQFSIWWIILILLILLILIIVLVLIFR